MCISISQSRRLTIQTELSKSVDNLLSRAAQTQTYTQTDRQTRSHNLLAGVNEWGLSEPRLGLGVF